METAHSSTATASAEKRRATFPSPITVTSVALKKGKPDTRALYARRYRNNTHDFDMLFVFEKTTRDFDRWRFVLEPGCRISDETGEYECTAIDHYPHPKHPMVQARLLNPRS